MKLILNLIIATTAFDVFHISLMSACLISLCYVHKSLRSILSHLGLKTMMIIMITITTTTTIAIMMAIMMTMMTTTTTTITITTTIITTTTTMIMMMTTKTMTIAT